MRMRGMMETLVRRKKSRALSIAEAVLAEKGQSQGPARRVRQNILASIRVGPRLVFRPEGPILSAQAEGLGKNRWQPSTLKGPFACRMHS
jgi:hypothetical protein